MNSVIKNILAVIAGLVLGSAVNMGIVMLSGKVIPPPAGVNVQDIESLKASIHLFKAKHFIFPFLAHALGTLVGATLAAFIAASHKFKFALSIGVLFLCGGIANVFMIPAPTWFVVIDLVLAYLPMAWLGAKLAKA